MSNKSTNKLAVLAAGLVLAASLSGCTNMNPSEQRILSGAAIGTGAGALVTYATDGCITCGAVAGAAVGAVAGAIVSNQHPEPQ